MTMKYAALDLGTKVASDAIKTFDPHAFYKMRDGLFIGDFFRDNILAKAASVKKLPATTFKSFNLTKDAYDRDIIPCLPQNYEFDISEALARIAQMIGQQPNGKEGDLLNNGYANLFYVPGCVVSVCWFATYLNWDVDACLRDGFDWDAGRRVFVRN